MNKSIKNQNTFHIEVKGRALKFGTKKDVESFIYSHIKRGFYELEIQYFHYLNHKKKKDYFFFKAMLKKKILKNNVFNNIQPLTFCKIATISR